MKFVFPIAALLACVIFFMYLPLFANYCDNIDMDLQQYRLDKAVEMSTRAATVNGLQHGLVTFDRSELQEAEFNSGVVLDTYAQFMCFNYNLLPTEENRELMLNRSVMMVIGGRGFAVTQNEYGEYYVEVNGSVARVKGALDPNQSPYTPVANTGNRTFMGVYTPYIVKNGTPDNVGFDEYVSGSILANAKSYPVMIKNKATGAVASIEIHNSLPGDVTTSRVQHEALAEMSRAFMQAWYQLNNRYSTNSQLVLPDTITNMGVSSAANPGVMVLIEGFNIETTRPLRSEAFTGYKAVVRREVVAYTQTVNGRAFHFYCFRDQLDVDKAMDGGYPGIVINYVYPDMQEAATVVIEGCLTHTNEQKCTCPDAFGNPRPPHCHYQPNMALLEQ